MFLDAGEGHPCTCCKGVHVSGSTEFVIYFRDEKGYQFYLCHGFIEESVSSVYKVNLKEQEKRDVLE